jgi:hypothetical protein
MGYLGTKPANSPLTSELIPDGMIGTSDLANGAVTIAKISATGTPSSSNYLRGDGSWQTVAGYTNSDALTLFNASGSAPVYATRAWVNFNGTGTVAIRASGNVSSITDNGTGNYTINFTTAMQDINYSLAGTSGVDGAAESLGKITPAQNVSAFATGSIRIICTGNTTTLYDANPVSVQIFR